MRANYFAAGLMALLIVSSSAKAGDNAARSQFASLSKVPVTPQGVNSMPGGGATSAPFGFVSFCLRFADQCNVPSNGSSTMTLSASTWTTLDQVNRAVDEAIVPMDDLHHYGIAEYWNIPTDGVGDCEDYALTKRSELIKAGFPIRALRIAIVKTEDNQQHAVLTIVTDRGDYVLDNLTQTIRLWKNTDYTWIERQDPDSPSGWISLGTPQPRLASAQS